MSLLFFVSTFAQQSVIAPADELVLPQYAYYGANSNARLHYVCRLKLTGLTPSTIYRYTTGLSTQDAISTSFVPGHFMSVLNTAGAFGNITAYATRAGLNGNSIGSNGFFTGGTNLSNYYMSFTTDTNGDYTGWFIAVPTGAALHHGSGGTSNAYFYVTFTPGAGATFSPTRAFRTTSTINLLNYTTTTDGVTALVGDSNFGAEKFVSLYDNDAATGRPLCTTYTEDDGINISTATTGTSNYVTTGLAWTTWYNLVDANTNGWGAVIPNTLPNGVRVIRYTNIDGTSAGTDRTSADGVFGTVSTVNPAGGTTAINLDPTTLPISLTSFTGAANTNTVRLNWSTASEISNQYFEVLRAGEDRNFVSLGRLNGAGNSSTSKSYSFDDNNPATGNNYYQLKQHDVDGKSTSFGPVAVKFGLAEDSFSVLSTSESSVSVSISSAAAKEGVISYLGIDGRVLYKQNISVKSGINTFNIPVDQLTGRIGVISFTSGGEQKSLKISR